MAIVLDTPTWCVYQAEQSLALGREFETIRAVEEHINDIHTRMRTWWRDQYGPLPVPRITARLEGLEDPDDEPPSAHSDLDDSHELTAEDDDLDEPGVWIGSYAEPDREIFPTEWVISMHPSMLYEAFVLHELAHCYGPMYRGDLVRARRHMRRRQIPSVGEHHSHGPMFTATLAMLYDRFGTAVDPGELAAAYRHYEVPVADTAEYDSTCADQHELHEIYAEFQRWVRDLDAEPTPDPAVLSQRPPSRPTRIPDSWWGQWLFSARRQASHGRTETFKAIAAAVSRVEPCSPRTIARLERARVRPSKTRDLRIALAAAAYLDLDPVWLRTAQGLVRWRCGIDLDELRQVSPTWVARVERLNTMLDTRPERWHVDLYR